MNADDDADILAAARDGFLDEAADMIQRFEEALLVMETAPDDVENLNAAFRAAHTIKGTAGIFGCDDVVSFTHEVETLMDALRAGQMPVNEAITAALLACRDQMDALMAEVRSGLSDPAVKARGVALGERLRAFLPGHTVAPADAHTDVHTEASGAPGLWLLSLRFGPDALRHGLDPLAFLRYLRTVARVQAMHLLDEAVPMLDALDAETCHLGFELALSDCPGRAAIDEVFEFALDDCAVDLLAPDADDASRHALLRVRCGEDAQAQARLCALWHGLGLPVPAPLMTPLTSPAPALAELAEIDQRGAQGDRRSGERRVSEADRRATAREPRTPEHRFVKVRADKLDKLIDLIGELVIAGSGAQMVANQAQSPVFIEAAQRVADLVQATRDGALALRMVPIGETFSRFQRVVRDTSKQLGKAMELIVTGGDTELDKSMVEQIGDPLMHLVRNSLDHGIEPPDERERAGKPPQGRLGLNAYHEAGAIVIEVSDDGRGLSRPRIVAKAIERGLITDDAGMSDAEVWDLIFAAGFSTADQVTDLSGRGVGMDVVRRNIEALRGQVSLVSIEGQGTTTQIRLPLTLAMIDGFLTRVGGVHYVLPLGVVSECIEVPPECHAAPERTCGTFDLRGEVLPYLDLARFYGVPAGEGGRRSLIVVREGAVHIGLVVDRLLGEHQTVIKPLASIFKPLEGLAGSTILGSGEVALVLDMPGLLAAALRPAVSAPSSFVDVTPTCA